MGQQLQRLRRDSAPAMTWNHVEVVDFSVAPDAVVTELAGQFLLTRTVFGRYCIAIGTNEEAVRMSGIRSRPESLPGGYDESAC
jgi:ribose/xylose/arabinose/galactoside ABC-type transport system permease subunit